MREYFKYYIFIFLLIFSSCTDNPFFSDQDFSSDKLSIKGKIELDHAADNGNVYVWLEGLDVSTYTNNAGVFNLKLKSPSSLPGGAAAWNGLFKLYYYVSNYKYEYSSVLIRNGKVEYGEYDVNDRGEINQTIQLNEILGISTNITPQRISLDFLKGQEIDILFEYYDYPVSIETYEPQNEYSACVIFRKIGFPNSDALFLLVNYTEYRTIDFLSSINWVTRLGGGEAWAIHPIPIESGEYEIIPYLIIHQDGLPEELLLSISTHYNTFTTEYLKLPFKWQPAVFTVE